MNSKRKTTEDQIRQEAFEEVEALLEQGVAPRPPKKQVAKKTAPAKLPPKKRPAPKKPLKKPRWNSITFLLTFPRWEGTETLEELLEQLHKWCAERDRDVLEAIIAIEEHEAKPKDKGHENGEDPGRHIHACFKLDKAFNTQNPAFFDTLFGTKHGNIQTCRDYSACQIYCNKDGNVITFNVDIEAVVESTRTKKGVKHETVANFCRKEPRTLQQVDDKFPGYTLQHLNKISSYLKLQDERRRTTKQPYYGIDQAKTFMLGRTNPNLVRIVGWLNQNLPPATREHKQKQLWLHGPPNVGKSRLQSQISKYLNALIVANESQWWSGMNQHKEIIFFDEFTGYKCLTDMKRLLDGSEFPMPIKGELPFIKLESQNIPIIICSNSSPEQVYHNVKEERPIEFNGLMERILVIEVTQEFEVPWLTAPVQDESPDEEEQDEPTQPAPEPPHRPGTPPIKQRVLKRGKPLHKSQLLEIPEIPPVQIECQEELDMQEHSQGSDADDDSVIWEDHSSTEKLSQHSQDRRLKKALKNFKAYN